MKRLLICLLLICGWLTYRPVTAQAMPLPNKDEILAEEKVFHDRRMAYDVANLDFSRIQDNQAWFVGKIHSDADSPTNTTSAYFDADTGKFVRPPGAHDVFSIHGPIEILACLTSVKKNSIRYDFPMMTITLSTAQSSENTETYSPFFSSEDEVIVFRFNEQEKQWFQFRPVYLIPESWVPFVLPALKYVQTHADTFDVTTAPIYRTQLQTLLTDANPFLALAAARTLSHKNLLGADFVHDTLAHADGLRQSAFTYLVLKQFQGSTVLPSPHDAAEAPPEAVTAEDTAITAVAKLIDTAPTAGTLQSIGTGVIAQFHPRAARAKSDVENVMQLLRHVDTRQVAIGTHTAADDYLQTLLVMESIRPQASSASAKLK